VVTIQAELMAAISELTGVVRKLRQEMAVHNAEQKPIEEMVRNHELTLYGDKHGQAGIVADV